MHHQYSNLAGVFGAAEGTTAATANPASSSGLPEIDEAGYASLIVNPIRPILSLGLDPTSAAGDRERGGKEEEAGAEDPEPYYENAPPPPPPDLLQLQRIASKGFDTEAAANNVAVESPGSSSDPSPTVDYAKIDR